MENLQFKNKFILINFIIFIFLNYYFLIDHHSRRFSQPKRFKLKSLGRVDNEVNSDDCSSVSSKRNVDIESDFYSGTRHNSADMTRNQVHEFCE